MNINQLGKAISRFSFNLICMGKRAFLNVVYDGFLGSGKVPVANPFIAGIIV